MKLENLKFRVRGEEHSEAIQKRLFELGYGWCDGKRVMFTEKSFLFLDTALSYSISEDYFIKHYFKETTLDELYKMTPVKKIRLTSAYEAIVKNGFVEVGCQKIEFERIEELYNLIKQI